MDDTDYALGRTRAEYDRLIEQAELFRPLTERMLRAAGVGTGMHVLDVGCGVGDVSFLVGELVGPEGSVVGIDLDGAALRVADERRLTRGVTNVGFREGDARSVDAEHLFDAAVGRLVLMFMRDPTAALRFIGERVRPGGIVAFHEWAAGISPASAMNFPVLASLQNLLSATFERSGARLDIGTEPYRRMRDAGFEPAASPWPKLRCAWIQRSGTVAGLASGSACSRRSWSTVSPERKRSSTSPSDGYATSCSTLAG